MTAAALDPVQVLSLELTEPLPGCGGASRDGGGRYGAGTVLVRVHGVPVDVAHVDLGGRELTADELAAALGDQVLERVNAHLAADGHAPVDALPAQGLPQPATACAQVPPGATPLRVAVVVPTIGQQGRLEGVLAALQQQVGAEGLLEGGRFEVVVVDNRPGVPRTQEVLAGHPDVRRVVEERAGISYARNAGLAATDAEVVAFLDDDMTVDPGWLRALLTPFATDPATVAVTGLVLPSELESDVQLWFEQFGGFAKGMDPVVHPRPDATGLYPYLPGQYGTGGNGAFRAAWLREHGAFDPVLGSGNPCIGGEDIDVLLRVVLRGDRLVYEPRAVGWHQPYRDLDALHRQMTIYGTGLAAVLTKTALSSPRHAWGLARRVLTGLLFLLRPSSEKNSLKVAGYPESLTRNERIGFAKGPALYLRRKWALRQS